MNVMIRYPSGTGEEIILHNLIRSPLVMDVLRLLAEKFNVEIIEHQVHRQQVSPTSQ